MAEYALFFQSTAPTCQCSRPMTWWRHHHRRPLPASRHECRHPVWNSLAPTFSAPPSSSPAASRPQTTGTTRGASTSASWPAFARRPATAAPLAAALIAADFFVFFARRVLFYVWIFEGFVHAFCLFLIMFTVTKIFKLEKLDLWIPTVWVFYRKFWQITVVFGVNCKNLDTFNFPFYGFVFVYYFVKYLI